MKHVRHSRLGILGFERKPQAFFGLGTHEKMLDPRLIKAKALWL